MAGMSQLLVTGHTARVFRLILDQASLQSVMQVLMVILMKDKHLCACSVNSKFQFSGWDICVKCELTLSGKYAVYWGGRKCQKQTTTAVVTWRKSICLILDRIWCLKWTEDEFDERTEGYELLFGEVEILEYCLRRAKWTTLQQESPSAYDCMTTRRHRQCWCPWLVVQIQ
jgi:hypothetical protein